MAKVKAYEQFKEFKYLLYGLGRSNKAVKTFFDEHGFNYMVFIDGLSVEPKLDSFDIVIKSPGIFPNTFFMEKLKENNKLIINDLELFSWFYPESKLIIVTGTNGKTSTCKLISNIITKKCKCYLGGNVGIPLFSLISERDFKNEIVIVEASSFMLDNCYTVKPYIYVLLNIFEHHLDYHQSFQNYFSSKLKLINNLDENSYLIYPNNEVFEEEFKNVHCIKYRFDNEKSDLGVCIENNAVFLNEELLYKNKSYPIVLYHQLRNILVAASIGVLLDIKASKIRKALEDLTFEKFRLEKVYDDKKTIILNDSKSTNWASSKAAIESINNLNYNVYLIMGGYGDVSANNNFSVLNKVNHVYLFGDNKFQIKDLLDFELIDNSIYNDLESIIQNIKDIDEPKIILFSPGSQSYDHYNNFEERGEHFNRLINKYWHN